MSHINNFDDLFQSFDMPTLDDLFVILPKNESLYGDEAAVQSEDFSTVQHDGFSLCIEPSAQPTDPSWMEENMQSSIDATWNKSDMPAATFVPSQPSDVLPKTETEHPVLDGQSATGNAPQLTSYSCNEFQVGAPPPVIAAESTLRNPPSTLESCVCGICGDRATGKHYGAVSCDGCKGFFRRSVRKFQEYTCRFKRSCIVTKEKRNQCRFCRLRKCFATGMRKDAVQNERDKINYRRSSRKQNLDASNELIISDLLKAEEQNPALEATIAVEQIASIKDVTNSVEGELRRFVDWAKKLPEFFNLSIQDRLTLLKTGGANHLIMGVARRSFDRHDSLLLSNKSVILKDISNTDSNDSDDLQKMAQTKLTMFCCRIFRELIQPWKSVNMDDVEFACLKSIVFFNPNAKGLANTARVEAFRDQVQINLENHISDRQYEGAGRLGKMLLTLPSVQSISKGMTEDIFYFELFYGKQIDDISREML